MSRITQQQLESYLWGAATLLRGTIDAGDYKQFIFPLLFYKRLCDVYDEETQSALSESGGDADYASGAEQHRFQIPSEAHWREVRQGAKNVGAKLHSAMRSIETANPEKLYGIFGDAQWTNKDRLSDAMLRDLIEHFGSLELTLRNLPEDELGQGYEYLIKKFADDSGHTAAEFYTNRTVVHLMTEMLKPQPGESIYDPTCGSGGMLLSAVAHLRAQNKEWRNVRLYGQERNLMTSSIARMNCFLHGIENFRIERGDTLSEPKLVEGDRLMRFDVVLANPPYSIKQWDRESFASDLWGRNLYGTPPQGRADYAFWQHVTCSMSQTSGRCAILFPHGVLFRQEEAEMRRQIIDADLIECILGLGPNLFYNSPMEACVVVCCTAKPKARKGRILFINAIKEVTRDRAQSFLTPDHISRIITVYERFTDEPGLARVATLEEVRLMEANLSIPLYVAAKDTAAFNESPDLASALDAWLVSTMVASNALAKLVAKTDGGPADKGLKINPHLTEVALFERKGWTKVRFGDVVQNVNETESNPANAGIDRFIGLEHLKPGSLNVRSWGNVADSTTFSRRCRPGQVLFGKRRAYQRKVAIAEFDAVVSGDIYVLEPVDDRLLPQLLPFVCMSDRFFEHAVGTSAGSLSPRTNWSSLASFEFALPPVDQQKSAGALLAAINVVRQLQPGIDAAHEALLQSFSDYAASPNEEACSLGKTVTLGDIADVIDCKHRTPKPAVEGVPVVSPGNIKWGALDLTQCKLTSESEYLELMDHCSVREWDLVMGRNQTFGVASFVKPGQRFVLGQDTVLIQARNLTPKCLYLILQSSSLRSQIDQLSIGSTFKRINLRDIRALRIPVPSENMQRKADEFVDQRQVNLNAMRSKAKAVNALSTAVLTALFGRR